MLNSIYLCCNVSYQGCLDSLLLDECCFRQTELQGVVCAHSVSALTLNSVWNEMPVTQRKEQWVVNSGYEFEHSFDLSV